MSEWVKTTARRPKNDQRVIYWFSPSEAAFVGIYDAEADGFGGRHGFCDQHDATHWMPLPPPPEDGT